MLYSEKKLEVMTKTKYVPISTNLSTRHDMRVQILTFEMLFYNGQKEN